MSAAALSAAWDTSAGPGAPTGSDAPAPATSGAGRRALTSSRYVLGQVAKAFSLVVAVTACTFFLAKVSPLDPVDAYFGADSLADDAQRAALAHKWGLDEPALVQYARWWANALRGDLGTSLMLHRPVLRAIGDGLANSALLLATAWLVSGLLGAALGVLAARCRGRSVDVAIRALCYVFTAVPTFWFAMVMLLVFGVLLGWFPIGMSTPIGATAAETSLAERIHHMLLPALTLSVLGISTITMQTRAALVAELDSDHALFARSRGASDARILREHGLRHALLPFVTLQFGSVSEIIGGSVLVETVFSYAGLGGLTAMAGLKGDLPLLIGITVISSAIVFAGNLVANLLYPVIDPRIRQEWS